jgi:diguanylate cyclase (GGDEF)-like protein
MFFERDDGKLRCTFAEGKRAESFARLCLSLERENAYAVTHAALSGEPVSDLSRRAPLLPGDRRFIAQPMIEEGLVTGVFYTSSPHRAAFEGLDEIAALVDLATPAYRLAVQWDDARRRATIDDLTGLLTARAFRRELTQRLARSARLSLLFIDTDNFKACNDRFGHARGDDVLRTLGRLLLEHSGPHATAGRNGGDEFCVLLPGVSKLQGIHLAESIRLAVEAYPFRLATASESGGTITASIGIAVYPDDAARWHELLEAADAAMYHSKSAGRNCVSFYDPSARLTTLRPAAGAP